MRRLLVRLVVVAALVGGAFAPASPAAATTAGTLSVVGTMVLGAGFSYSCMPAIDLSKCPVIGLENAVAAGFAGTAVGAIGQVDKAKCGAAGCAEAGSWAVVAAGGVTGRCDRWSGTLAGMIVPVVAVGKAKPRPFTLTLVSAGGQVVGTGATAKGEVLVAAGTWAPDVLSGSSCTNKAAKATVLSLQLAVAR